ncbi:hypothetical protein Trydic_g14795 [Trypoxylus dichotomus]
MNHPRPSCDCLSPQKLQKGCFYKNSEIACLLKYSYEIADFLSGSEESTTPTDHHSEPKCQCRKPKNKISERGKRCYEKRKEKVIDCYQRHPMEPMHCAPSVREFKKCVEDIKQCINKS